MEERYKYTISLEKFNESAERAQKYYEDSKSEEAKKEKQKKIDDWRKAMDDPKTWFPKPVKLEITEIKVKRWKGVFHNFSWKSLKVYGLIKCIKNFCFGVKLSMNQKIQYKQHIVITGFDTNDKLQKVKLTMNSREFFTKLFAKKERIYVYKDILTGEIKIKRAKNLRDLYGKVGGLYRIESLGWLPIDLIEEMKKTIKELSYER